MKTGIFNKHIATIFCAGLLAAGNALADSAPSFTLPGEQHEVSLVESRGSVVYVDFWASWCTPCRKSFPWMNEMQARYEEDGLQIIAINLDESREQAEEFLARNGVDFTVAFDPAGKTASDFSVMAMPSSFLIDRNGNIIHKHIGFRQKDKNTIENSIRQALEADV